MGLLNIVKLVAILLSVSIPSNAERFGVFQRRQRGRDEEGGQPAPIISGFSGLPVPNGPFYGHPFDLSATMGGQFPFTVAGNCERGKIYTVTSGADLLNYRTELECVFNAGFAPKQVPEGPFIGTVLSVMNSQLFNTMISNVWKGKMINKIKCNGNETYIGWNNVGGQPISPFVANVQPLNLNLAPGEYYDGQDSLVLDYSQDFNKVCPDYRAFIQKNYDSAVVRRRNLNGVYPVNQVVDSVRLVGKQEDGGLIYLGKTYMKDFYRTDLQAATIAYFYVVNHDENALPLTSFLLSKSLIPLINGFKYMHPGAADFLLRILPFDNLLTTPIRTIGKFVRGLWKQGRNSLNYAGERSNGGNFIVNQKRFLDAFNAGRNFGRRN